LATTARRLKTDLGGCKASQEHDDPLELVRSKAR
jgi:hypothetical protein